MVTVHLLGLEGFTWTVYGCGTARSPDSGCPAGEPCLPCEEVAGWRRARRAVRERRHSLRVEQDGRRSPTYRLEPLALSSWSEEGYCADSLGW